MVKNSFILFLTVFAVFTLFPINIFAYLDPGTGSYVIQILIAGVAGAGFLLKTYWGKIMSIFKKDKKDESEK